jgi:hypothetical protein
MKVVHLSDIHLGFKQYSRQTAHGHNQREADIARVFRDAIEKIIEIEPDLILVGGDVFHNVRPTNPAILHAYQQFSKLVKAVPDAEIVMVAGNHDQPRTSETGCLLGLFESLGISVATDEPRRFALRGGEASVLAIPHKLGPRPKLDPDPTARFNLLLIHREYEPLYRKFGGISERSAGYLTLNELSPQNWDYVALGHYHVYSEIAPNAYYSGSLEYSSKNIWQEVDEEYQNKTGGKGFIEHNLETGYHRFHNVTAARRVVDLPPIDASDMTPEQVSEAIREVVDACEGGIDDKIVRLIVREIPRHVIRDLDHRSIRDFKRRALNFLLDTRRPAPVRVDASGAPGRRASLTDTVRSMLEKRALTPGIDRAALVQLGLRYLAQAEGLAQADSLAQASASGAE